MHVNFRYLRRAYTRLLSKKPLDRARAEEMRRAIKRRYRQRRASNIARRGYNGGGVAAR